MSGQICVSEGETVAASVRNCAIESAINMTMKRMTASRRSVSTQGNSRREARVVRENRRRGPAATASPWAGQVTADWLHDAARAGNGQRRGASCAHRPAQVEEVDGRRAIAANHSIPAACYMRYSPVARDIIFSPTLPGAERSLNHRPARIPPGTRNGGRWAR